MSDQDTYSAAQIRAIRNRLERNQTNEWLSQARTNQDRCDIRELLDALTRAKQARQEAEANSVSDRKLRETAIREVRDIRAERDTLAQRVKALQAEIDALSLVVGQPDRKGYEE